jgi:hypothetical protein
MMKKSNLILGIISTVAIGIIIYQVSKVKTKKRLLNISDAGYEFAYDILYPVKTKRAKKS